MLTKFRFDEEIPRFQDLEILINIMNSRNYELYCINESLLDDYKVSRDSISVNSNKLITALEILERKYPDLKIYHLHYPGIYQDILDFHRK